MPQNRSVPPEPLGGIQSYVREVLLAVDTGLYRLALVGALTIPDIMSALEAEDGRTSGRLYESWFDRHVGALFSPAAYLEEPLPSRISDVINSLPHRDIPVISGKQCYRWRCAVLHQARGRQDPSETRLAFREPGTGGTIHLVPLNVGGERFLYADLVRFCRAMVRGATEWLATHQADAIVEKNLAEVMTRYPNGAGGFSGIPIIT